MSVDKGVTALAVAVVVVVGSMVAFGGVAAAQDGLFASVDATGPEETTAGTPTAFDVTLSSSEGENFSVTADVVVRLKVDDETVAREKLDLSDGETRTVTLEHTFAEDGTVDVTAEATATGFGLTITRSDETTVTVTGAEEPPRVPGLPDPATDPDEDGLYEDLNGDGTFDLRDVRTFLFNVDAVEGERRFDFNGDGAIDLRDVRTLLQAA